MTDLAARILATATNGDIAHAGFRIAWAELCDAIWAGADPNERQRRFQNVIDTTRTLIADQHAA